MRQRGDHTDLRAVKGINTGKGRGREGRGEKQRDERARERMEGTRKKHRGQLSSKVSPSIFTHWFNAGFRLQY